MTVLGHFIRNIHVKIDYITYNMRIIFPLLKLVTDYSAYSGLLAVKDV